MLVAWSGLGYNRRALALQGAARVVSEQRLAGGSDRAARRRAVHRGRGRLVRLGSAGRGRGHERAAGAVAPRRRRLHAASAGVARRRAAPAGTGGDVQPGDDGARRDRLPSAGAPLRGVSGRRRLRAGRARSRAGRRSRASRTPIGGRAGASWRRCWPARSRRWTARAASERSPGSSATGWSCAARLDTSSCLEPASIRAARPILSGRGSRGDRASRLSRRAAAATTRPQWMSTCAASPTGSRLTPTRPLRRCRRPRPSRSARSSRPRSAACPRCAPARTRRRPTTSSASRDAADGMLAKLDDLERELGNLLAALRASGERLIQGLEDLQAEVGGRRAGPGRASGARSGGLRRGRTRSRRRHR